MPPPHGAGDLPQQVPDRSRAPAVPRLAWFGRLNRRPI
jgi:hypothetical protein